MEYNAAGSRQNVRIIDQAETKDIRVEVLEYTNLEGLQDLRQAEKLYFMSKQNIRARQIAVYLNNSSVKMQPGAMSYYRGNIEMRSGLNAANVMGKIFSGAVMGEAAAMPEYSGTGIIVLEPSFRHFIVVKLNKEELIVDKGMFFCASGGITVSPVMMKSVSSALFGNEGLFQISLSGTGIAVLECGAPFSEIDIVNLNNDVLKVDGNFAVARSGSLSFTVERSAKTLLGSAASGEGLVNTYRGTGQVWLAPTLKIYEMLLPPPPPPPRR